MIKQTEGEKLVNIRIVKVNISSYLCFSS